MKGNEIIKDIIREEMPDREQVRINCINQINDKIPAGKNNANRKILKFKNLIAVMATITMLIMLSAFVEIPFLSRFWDFGKVSESFAINGFVVNKVDGIEPKDGVDINIYLPYELTNPKIGTIWSYDITDPKVNASMKGQKLMGEYLPWDIATFEEAEKILAYPLKGLNYIPDGYSFELVSIGKDSMGDSYYRNSSTIYYRKDGEQDLYFARFWLSATYIGDNATVYINTTEDIEKIMLNGDTDAVFMVSEHSHSETEQDIIKNYTISWIKDGVLYQLSSRFFDIEEMIKMAESIE